MGKSTLFGYMAMKFCHTMAKKYSYQSLDQSLNIVALHFFNYYDLEDKSIETALRSISFQLCETIPGFAACLARDREELEENLKKFKNNVKSLFKFLILDPARTLAEQEKAPSKKFIILLDALDECEDPVQLTKTLHEGFASAPTWLVLIASTRPEHWLKQEIKQNDKIVNLIPSQEDNQKDLRVFVEKRMSRYLDHLDEFMVNELVRKSGGLFLWLSFQEQEIQRQITNSNDIFNLKSVIDKLPFGIEESYNTYFQRLYDRLEDLYSGQDIKTVYRSVVSIALIIPRAPLPESIWKASLGFNKTIDDQERYTKLKNATSCLLVFSNDHLRAPHKSMIDWLCQDGKNTAVGMEKFHLAIDKTSQKENHLKLLEEFHKIYSQVDPKLTYEFPLSRLLTVEEQFTFTHVLYHYCESGEKEETKKYLLDFKHLFWLVYQAVENNDYSRFIQDVIQAEEQLDSTLYFFPNLIRLSESAVKTDPRQLISQIVGRLSNNNTEKETLLKSCEIWLNQKPKNLNCYMPLNTLRAGLDQCDIALKAIFGGHTDTVCSLCLSDDGKTLFTCSSDKTARSWNIANGQQIHIFKGHTHEVNRICLSKDDKNLFTCSSDKTARSWSVETGEQIHVFEGHTHRVNSICVSNDQKTLFTCSSDKTARSWNVETGLEIYVFLGHNTIVDSLCLSKDDRTLFTCSGDKTVRSWGVESGEQMHIFNGHTGYVHSICLSSDGKTLFSASSHDGARSWNVQTGEQIHIFQHIGVYSTIFLSNDQKTLFTCSSVDRTARSWNIETGNQIRIVFKFNTNVIKENNTCLSNYEKTLFVSENRNVLTWNIETSQQQVFEGHTGSIKSICLSKDSKLLFTCSDDKTARSWNIENEQRIQVAEQAVDSILKSICLSNDYGVLFTLHSYDTAIRSWNALTGHLIHVFNGHTEWVDSICLSKDSKILFTYSSREKAVRSWNVETGKQIRVFKGHNSHETKSIRLSLDGMILQTCLEDRTSCYWNIETGEKLVSPDAFEQAPLQKHVKNLCSLQFRIGCPLRYYRCFQKGDIIYGFPNTGQKVFIWRLL